MSEPSKSNGQAPIDGIRRVDALGHPWVDALAGRASAVGFGCPTVIDAISQSAHVYLGDASAAMDIADNQVADNKAADDEPTELASALASLLESSGNSDSIAADSLLLFPAADLAIEAMIAFARKRNSEASYRTIAIAGSDHGRTALCRSASGQPHLHSGFGPMVAGFDHVKPNDLKALEAAIDDSTASVLLSPVNLANGARSIDGDYLRGVRQLCDQHDLVLLMDEARLCFGATGSCFTFASLADVAVDGIVVAGGLFAGLPGGVLIASERLTGRPIHQSTDYPIQSNVVTAMLQALGRLELPGAASELGQEFAVAVAEAIAGFEFIRDIHVTGMTLGIETDLAAAEIVSVAATNGLRIEASGEAAILLQPSLNLSPEDRESLLSLLLETMNAIEQRSKDLAV